MIESPQTPPRTRLGRAPALALAALTLALAGCHDEGTNDFTDATNPATQAARARAQLVAGALHFGVLGPVSSAEVESAFLAMEQVTAAGGVAGGRPVRPVFLEDSDDPPGAFDAKVEGLVLAGVDVILHVTSGGTQQAFTTASTSATVLHMGMAATSPLLTTLNDSDLVFRAAPSDAAQGVLLADRAVTEIATFTADPPRASVLFQAGDAYGEGIRQSFAQAFAAAGGTVVAEVGFNDATIAASVAQAFAPAATSTPHVVVLAALAEPDPGASIVTAWSSQGAPTLGGQSPWLFPDALVQDTFLQNVPSAVLSRLTGTLATGPALGAGVGFSQLASDLTQRFGRGPQPFSSNAYDAVALLALAAERSATLGNGTGAAAIRDQLRAIANAPGGVANAGVSGLADALSRIRAGQDVDYSGTYAAFDLDGNGDIEGSLAYTVFTLNAGAERYDEVETVTVTVTGP